MSVPIRNPIDPDPNEDCLLSYSDPYDERVLPEEQTEVSDPSNPTQGCDRNILMVKVAHRRPGN